MLAHAVRLVRIERDSPAGMNYRHGFHAGNFADVVKHAVLARILVHLKAKPAAFRVIDTHAGAGHYGVFSGRKWETQIYPLLKNVILASD